MDMLSAASKISGSALTAQSTRLRVVAENIANAQSTGTTPGAEGYRRKTVAFTQHLDRASGASLVDASAVNRDRSAMQLRFDPAHPAADAQGMVKMPNVNVLMEMADMRETNRSFEANLQVIGQVRDMVSATIGLMRGGA